MGYIKRLTSRTELFKQLKKGQHLHYSSGRYYMSDKHKRPVSIAVVEYFVYNNLIEKCTSNCEWFETAFCLKGEFRKCNTYQECKTITEHEPTNKTLLRPAKA